MVAATLFPPVMRPTDPLGPGTPPDPPLSDRAVLGAFLLVALVPLALVAVSNPLVVGSATLAYALGRWRPSIRWPFRPRASVDGVTGS
jgi:hypothetical protein